MNWSRPDEVLDVSVLVGKIVSKIDQSSDELVFTLDNGEKYKFYHSQDCCESVTIDDIAGDLDDLVGSPITKSEESTSGENPEGVTKESQDSSYTWTFYHFATVKGYVTVRWYGESNGYYSEKVDFVKVS